MILTTRGRGVKFPWHLYRPSLTRRPDLILIEEAPILPPKLLDPRLYRSLTHLTRCSKHPKCRTRRVTPAVLKSVKEVIISKIFTILNLLTLPARSRWRMVISAAVHGQTASIKNIVSVADAPFQPPLGSAHVKEAQMDTLHDAHALEHSMIV